MNYYRGNLTEWSPLPDGEESCSRRSERSAGRARRGARVTESIALLDHGLLIMGLDASPAKRDIDGSGAPDPDRARPSLCCGGAVALSVRLRCGLPPELCGSQFSRHGSWTRGGVPVASLDLPPVSLRGLLLAATAASDGVAVSGV